MTTTTTITSAALLAALIACEQERAKPPLNVPQSISAERDKPRPPKPADVAETAGEPVSSNPGAAVSPIELTWSLSRAADNLILDYEIVNPGDQPIFVVDDHAKTTSAGLALSASEVAILPGDNPDTVRFVAGHVPLAPGQASEVVPIAPARELPPKGRHKGTKTIALPLEAWIAAERRAVDLSSATRATFELTWLRPPPPERESWAWENQKTAGGQVVRTPFIGYVNTMGGQAKGASMPIP